MVDKVIRNGLVAIAVSRGYGAGWSTWNDISPFEPKVIDMIEKGKQKEIDEDWVKDNLGKEDQYCGGAEDLEIEWLPVGTRFTIHEYDGAESIKLISDLEYIA